MDTWLSFILISSNIGLDPKYIHNLNGNNNMGTEIKIRFYRLNDKIFVSISTYFS